MPACRLSQAIAHSRYTTFLPLYPLGASSEAFLSFSTLPPFSTLPFVPDSIKQLSPLTTLFSYLPASVGKSVMKHEWGRTLLWNMASAGLKGKAAVSREWTLIDGLRLVLFTGWWPGECEADLSLQAKHLLCMLTRSPVRPVHTYARSATKGPRQRSIAEGEDSLSAARRCRTHASTAGRQQHTYTTHSHRCIRVHVCVSLVRRRLIRLASFRSQR